MNLYDVIIVGAGPAGLMAAKTAAENGLKVALIDRKSNIAEIRRCCATMFAVESDYYFGERMYFCEKTKRLVFPVNGFSVNYTGPYKNFYCWHLYTSDAKHYIRLGNYEDKIKLGTKGRLSVTYSKKHLLEGLLREAEDKGAEIFAGVNITSLQKKNGTIVVEGDGKLFEGLFVIAADGINSRLVQILGLNKERIFYGTMKGISYYLSGLNLPHPYALVLTMLYHRTTKLPIAYWLEPSPFEECEYWLYVGGVSHPEIDYNEEIEYFINESPFSRWFVSPKVRLKMAHVANIWSPVKEPYKDNVLIVGDAGWTVEAECTGSMMCGWKAAHTISLAIRDGKISREGIEPYIQWWLKSFPGSQDYREFLEIIRSSLIGEGNLNYLYSLVTETLPYTLNPFNLIKYVNMAISKKLSYISKERPEVVQKIQQMGQISFEKAFDPMIRVGFPNL